MAFTVEESSAVNKLLSFLLGPASDGSIVAKTDEACDAAALLAARADARLMAGYTPEKVRARWHERFAPRRGKAERRERTTPL